RARAIRKESASARTDRRMGRRPRPGNSGKAKPTVGDAVSVPFKISGKLTASSTDPVPNAFGAATTSTLRNLLGRLFGTFFTDFFFDLAAPFAREPRAQKAVKQIRKKQDGRHP